MIIICAGLQRTGSTVQRQLTSAIVGKLCLGFTPQMPVSEDWSELAPIWASSDKWVVAKSHKCPDWMHGLEHQTHVQITVRDPRDMVVSWSHFMNMTIQQVVSSDFIEFNMLNFKRWMSYEASKRIVRYEDFHVELDVETRKIAEFMKLRINKDDIDVIARSCSKVANIARANANYPIDHPEYMARREIYSGATKQWIGTMTGEQIRSVELRAGDFMDEFHYIRATT